MRKLPCIQVRNPETNEILQILITPLGLIPENPKDFFQSAVKYACAYLFREEPKDSGDLTFRRSYFRCLAKFSYMDSVSKKEIEKEGYLFKDGLLFLTGSLIIGELGSEFEPSHKEQIQENYKRLVVLQSDSEELTCGLS